MFKKNKSSRRNFIYDGSSFGDPYPSLSISQVQDLLSVTYPELASTFCSTRIHIDEDGVMNIIFEKTAGIKSSCDKLPWNVTIYLGLITKLHLKTLYGGVQGRLTGWVLSLLLPQSSKSKEIVIATARVAESNCY